MPPFRRHLLYLTTEQHPDDEQSFSTSATASPAQLEPSADDSILVTPAPPKPLLASLHARPPPAFQTSDVLNSKQKCQSTIGAEDGDKEASWPLAVAAHDTLSTDHHCRETDDEGRRRAADDGSPEGFRAIVTQADGVHTGTTSTVRNFSRPFISATAIQFETFTETPDARAANSGTTTATTAKTSPTTPTLKTSPAMTNAMKETQSTKAKRRSISSPVSSPAPSERRGWSVVSRISTQNQSPLAAKSPPARQNDTNVETRNVVAGSHDLSSEAWTSSLPSTRGKFNGGRSHGSVNPRSDANGGSGQTGVGPDVKKQTHQSLKRQRSSHASQASLNELYRHQEANESPKSPPKNVPGLIGIAWSGIADEWWPPRSSSRCRYTQTARDTHTAHRLSSINEMREDPPHARERKHDQNANIQSSRSGPATRAASRSAVPSRDGTPEQSTPKRMTDGFDTNRTTRSDKRRSQDRTTEKLATKNDRTDAAKDVWGSTVVIKKRREREMMKVREKAVWW